MDIHFSRELRQRVRKEITWSHAKGLIDLITYVRSWLHYGVNMGCSKKLCERKQWCSSAEIQGIRVCVAPACAETLFHSIEVAIRAPNVDGGARHRWGRSYQIAGLKDPLLLPSGSINRVEMVVIAPDVDGASGYRRGRL